MGTLARYHAANLPELFEKISRNSIGMDDYFNRFWDGVDTSSNYPPYNLVNVSNHESRLEVALAGFKKKEVKVYTEYGKLHITGSKSDKDETEYVHKGLAQRSFERSWTIADDTIIKEVVFEDGLLTVTLGKVIPEHHSRKDYL